MIEHGLLRHDGLGDARQDLAEIVDHRALRYTVTKREGGRIVVADPDPTRDMRMCSSDQAARIAMADAPPPNTVSQ